jgi:hypothetical protein
MSTQEINIEHSEIQTVGTQRAPERIKCAHCKAEGTCTNAGEGLSCAICIKRNNLELSKTYKGLACSVCRGRGTVEPLTYKIINRFLPMLAMAFVFPAFALIFYFGWARPEHFNNVMIFSSTLISGITGYYFGGAKSGH